MNDSLDWVSGLLDGRADSQHSAQELERDTRLQREAEIVGSVRTTVRNRSAALRTPVPPSLERSIRMAIAQEAQRSQEPSAFSRLREFLGSAIMRPSYAVAALSITAIVAVVTVSIRQQGLTLPDNISDAALEMYSEASVDGATVDRRSADKNDLRAFFASQGVRFEVFFPTVAAELIGGSVRKINGQDFPVLVYRAAGHVISLLEVDEQAITENAVKVDRIAADDVAESKWHWASAENKTLFVWKSNSIMCSVVSDLAVDEVSALFRLEAL